jgi:calmodulin
MMTAPTRDIDFEAEMKSAFKVFDLDGSGTISLDELRRVMKSFGEMLTEDELDSMIKEVDKNGDGTIDCKSLEYLERYIASLCHLLTLPHYR